MKIILKFLKLFFSNDTILNIRDDLEIVIGSSVGSCIAASIALGITSQELIEKIQGITVKAFINIKAENLLQFPTKFGIDSGEAFLNYLKYWMGLFNKDFNITLKEIYDQSNIHLILVTTCIKQKKCCYLDHINYPDMPLLIAIRASCCVPIIYNPVEYKDHLFIDGTITNDLPFCLVKDKLDSSIGFYFKINTHLNNLAGYMRTILECMLHTNTFSKRKYKENIQEIDMNAVELFQDLNQQDISLITEICYQISKKFIIDFQNKPIK